MRTTFYVTPNGDLVSSIAPVDTPHALQVGTKLALARPFDTGFGNVPEGTIGYVEALDEYDGTATIFVERIEPALFHWRNRLVISPFTCEDLVACVKAAS